MTPAYPKPTATKKKKRKKLQPLPKLLKKVQVVFNTWIRNRDKDETCISCRGKVAQAGHYISRGSSSHLRFNEDNVHGQCAGCNLFKSGNIVEFRFGIIKKIGFKRVHKIEEQRHDIKSWKRDELMKLLEKYKS